ncbi:hypothetical protein HN51_007416 [Arachis hypogaea]
MAPLFSWVQKRATVEHRWWSRWKTQIGAWESSRVLPMKTCSLVVVVIVNIQVAYGRKEEAKTQNNSHGFFSLKHTKLSVVRPGFRVAWPLKNRRGRDPNSEEQILLMKEGEKPRL